MNELKIITPAQLWANYNPVQQPLEVAYLDMRTEGDAVIKELYLTGDEVMDGKVRVYVKIVYPAVLPEEKVPAIIYAPPAAAIDVADTLIDSVIKKGCIFVTFDYTGKRKPQGTVFPASVNYCGSDEAFINKMNEGTLTELTHTAWFEWIKLARRVITLVCDEACVNTDRIALIGIREGAHLAWKVAGIDGRITALVPIIGSSYSKYKGPKFGTAPAAELNQSQMMYLAAMSPQAYAKLVTCPVMYHTTTNSSFSDVDRLGEILDLVPSANTRFTITPRASESVNEEALNSAMVWLENVFSSKGRIEQSPRFDYYVSENKLYGEVKVTGDVEKVEIYVASNDVEPELRGWGLPQKALMVNETEYLLHIEVPASSKKLFVFSNVQYTNGLVLSTEIVCIKPQELNIASATDKQKSKTRIIFSSSEPNDTFLVENDLFAHRPNKLYIKSGAFGIKGVCSNGGSLVSYRLGDDQCSGEEGYILQMDAYTLQEKEVAFTMYTYDGGFKAYTAVRKLPASKRWQRLKFVMTDFKDPDRHTIKSWAEVRKFEITHAEEVLFNNILWV